MMMIERVAASYTQCSKISMLCSSPPNNPSSSKQHHTERESKKLSPPIVKHAQGSHKTRTKIGFHFKKRILDDESAREREREREREYKIGSILEKTTKDETYETSNYGVSIRDTVSDAESDERETAIGKSDKPTVLHLYTG